MPLKLLKITGTIIGVVLLVAVGFVAYLAYANRLDVLSQIQTAITNRLPNLSEATQRIQSISQFVKENPLVTPIIGAVGTLGVGAFINYLKNRQIQKEQQLQADLNAKLLQAGGTVASKQKEIETLKAQIANTPTTTNNSGLITDLQTNLSEAERMVRVKAGELSNANAVIQSLQLQVEKLSIQVESLKPKPIP